MNPRILCSISVVLALSVCSAMAQPKGEEVTAKGEVIDLWSDGFSYVQISEITSQTEGHIRVLVHRGLKAIREHPQVRALMSDKPAAQRRNCVAVGARLRKADPKQTD